MSLLLKFSGQPNGLRYISALSRFVATGQASVLTRITVNQAINTNLNSRATRPVLETVNPVAELRCRFYPHSVA
jgi:hypothetical protein